jgi:hypothetical protein
MLTILAKKQEPSPRMPASTPASTQSKQQPIGASQLLWVPAFGLLYALVCTVSEKYFHPFQRMFHYKSIYGVSVGAIFFRLLLIAPFVIALIPRRSSRTWNARFYGVSAGMSWPLLISTLNLIANSNYAIIWTWVLGVFHIYIAVLATSAVCRGEKMARWCWLGVLYGLGLWFVASLAG